MDTGGRPFYVYGTIHVADPRVTALPRQVTQALVESDALLTEVSLSPSSMMEMARSMQLSGGQSLRDLLPAPLLDRAEEYARRRGFPASRLHRLKVWAVMLTLGALDARQDAGADVLDQLLVRRARELGRTLDALETVAEQTSVFDTFSTQEQVTMLEGMLDLLDRLAAEGRNPVDDLVELYLAGDADELVRAVERYSIADTTPGLRQRLSKALLTDRNRRMAQRILQKVRLHQHRRFFFAIGAAHCPGPDGVLQLLARNGLRVERIGAPVEMPAASPR